MLCGKSWRQHFQRRCWTSTTQKLTVWFMCTTKTSTTLWSTHHCWSHTWCCCCTFTSLFVSSDLCANTFVGNTLSHSYTLMYMQTYMHTHTHACMQACTHMHMCTHTHTHKHAHTHTHTHTHTTHKVFVYSCILLLTHLLVQTHMSNFAIYFEVPMCMTLMRVCLYPVWPLNRHHTANNDTLKNCCWHLGDVLQARSRWWSPSLAWLSVPWWRWCPLSSCPSASASSSASTLSSMAGEGSAPNTSVGSGVVMMNVPDAFSQSASLGL